MAFAEVNCLYIAQWKTFLPSLALFLSLIHFFLFSNFYILYLIFIFLMLSVYSYPHYGVTVSKHSLTSIFL